MDNEVPLSSYYNNPGNLKPPKGVTYEGQVGVDPDTGFAIFQDPEYGHKALVGDISAKIKRGLNTPDKFIDVYTPKDDNNEESRANYKTHIAKSLGLKSPNDPFPEKSAEQIAKAISEFESGNYTNKPTDINPMSGKSYEDTAKDTEKSGKAFDGSELNTNEVSEAEKLHPKKVVDDSDPRSLPGVQKAEKSVLGTLGAVTGASTAAGIETGRKVLPLVPNIYSQVMGLDQNINRPSTRMSMQSYLNSQVPHTLDLHLSDLEKEVTNARRAVNPGAAPVKLRTMSEVQDALKEIKFKPEEVKTKPRVEMVEGKPGVFRQTGEFTTSRTPAQAGIDLTKYERNPKTPIMNEIKGSAKTAGNIAKGALPSIGRIGLGALGGLGALTSGYDTFEHAREHGWKDPRTWSKAAATLGGGLMMIPTPVTEAAGMALNAPELAWSGYDYLHNKQ
jgi:hypothetical protein